MCLPGRMGEESAFGGTNKPMCLIFDAPEGRIVL